MGFFILRLLYVDGIIRKKTERGIFLKKLLIVLALVGLLVGLVGCGSAASERNINIARQAVGIADEFLDGDIGARAARERIGGLADIDSTNTGNTRADAANLDLAIGIGFLSSSLFRLEGADTSDNFDSVIEARNDLARRIGMRAR